MFLEFEDVDTKEQMAVRKSDIKKVIIGIMPETNLFFVSIGCSDDYHSLYELKSKEEALKKYKELVEEISNENIKQPSAPATGFCIHVVSG